MQFCPCQSATAAPHHFAARWALAPPRAPDTPAKSLSGYLPKAITAQMFIPH